MESFEPFVDTEEEFSKLLPPSYDTLEGLYKNIHLASSNYSATDGAMHGNVTPRTSDSILSVATHLYPVPQRDAQRMMRVASLETEELLNGMGVANEVYELWWREGEGYYELRNPNSNMPCSEYDAQRLARCTSRKAEEPEVAS